MRKIMLHRVKIVWPALFDLVDIALNFYRTRMRKVLEKDTRYEFGKTSNCFYNFRAFLKIRRGWTHNRVYFIPDYALDKENLSIR